MAYYKLKSNIALRGWERLPHVVCDLEQGASGAVTADVFNILSLCDGKTDMDSLWIAPQTRELVRQMAKRNIVEECAEGAPLAEEQRYFVYPNRYMSGAHWSITGRCNYRCKHCFMSAPDAKFGELSTETCLHIVDELAACGIAGVNLTGGEPLVHPGWWQIVDRLAEHHIRIRQIYSNGALVTSRLLDGLEERGMKPEFNMSFDGVGWHDWLRGVPGAERRVIEAFKLCHDRGFPTSAELCLHRHNVGSLRESVNLLASLGVLHLKVSPVTPSGAWLTQDQQLTPSDEEVMETYLAYVPHFFEDGAPLQLMLSGLFFSAKGGTHAQVPSAKYDGTERSRHCNICGSARSELYISADGRALPCMPMSGLSIEREFPKITEIGLREVLKDSVYMRWVGMTLGEYLEHNKQCAGCAYRYICGGGCRAGGVMRRGDYTGTDEATCKIFKNGYYTRMKGLIDRYAPKDKK